MMDSNPRLDEGAKQVPRQEIAASPSPGGEGERSPPPVPETETRKRWLIPVFLGGLALLLLGTIAFGWTWRFLTRQEQSTDNPSGTPADPRLAYNGPFRNIHPDVGYVGDERCAACHPQETETFHQHPMGRSIISMARLAPQQPYDAKHNNPFKAVDSRFRVERKGDRVWHLRAVLDDAGQTVAEYGPEVHYAIGSGSRGYSYVTDEDGYLFQTAISWYTEKQIWDLSPGFSIPMPAQPPPGPRSPAAEPPPETTVLRVTLRPITSDCLYCHADRAHLMSGYLNRYDHPRFSGHAISCERCHGPGEKHVVSSDPLDIVSPGRKRLSDPALRDAVCAQCHLQGADRVLRRGRDQYDFRPGLPLEEFWSVFVRPTTGKHDSKAVSHFEQMHLSRCFRESSTEKKLGCISCHDPHVKPTPQQRVAHYRQRCLQCHEEHGCSVPREKRLQTSKEDSCIECHMHRFATADVAHTAATDHRILRRPDPVEDKAKKPTPAGQELVLAHFGHERIDLRDRDMARDMAIALVKSASLEQAPPQRAGARALALLTSALKEHPDDLEAWIARGWALMLTGDKKGAVTAFSEVLKRSPQHERALAGAASLAYDIQQFDMSLDYWRRVVAMNPWISTYRRGLAFLLAREHLWDELRPQCQEWLRLDPTNLEARMLWISCLLHDGKKAEARAEFARIEAQQPKDLEEWKKRYQDMLNARP